MLLIVQHGNDMVASVCGVIGNDPTVWDPVDLSQIERLAASALEEPDRHSASKLLTQMLPEATGPLPGIRNSGLLSTHQLNEGVRTRPDWDNFCSTGEQLLRLSGRELLQIDPADPGFFLSQDQEH